MQTETPVLQGLVVPEELEGPVKRPGWNSCDQPLFAGGREIPNGIVLLAPVKLWCNTCCNSSEMPSEKLRKLC